jgi:hypothetical protein
MTHFLLNNFIIHDSLRWVLTLDIWPEKNFLNDHIKNKWSLGGDKKAKYKNKKRIYFSKYTIINLTLPTNKHWIDLLFTIKLLSSSFYIYNFEFFILISVLLTFIKHIWGDSSNIEWIYSSRCQQWLLMRLWIITKL